MTASVSERRSAADARLWQASDNGEISLMELAAAVVSHLKIIVAATLVGGTLALLPTFFGQRTYTATASFVPNLAEESRSSIAGLAGQFGLSLQSGDRAQSPQFYADLLRRREILTRVVTDTYVVAERGGRRMTFAEVFEIEGDPQAAREAARRAAAAAVRSSFTRETGIVDLAVATPFASVSHVVATRLLEGVSEFNVRSRQSTASEERRFVEQRLAVASDSLRAAEDRLERFMRTNREWRQSPELTFEYDRLQRHVGLQSQVFTTLTQSFENARIREVRNTPVITTIDPPELPVRADSLHRFLRLLIGLIVGALVSAIAVIVLSVIAARRSAGDPRAERFIGALTDLGGDLTRLVRPRSIGAKST